MTFCKTYKSPFYCNKYHQTKWRVHTPYPIITVQKKVCNYVEKSRLNRYEHNFLIWTASLSLGQVFTRFLETAIDPYIFYLSYPTRYWQLVVVFFPGTQMHIMAQPDFKPATIGSRVHSKTLVTWLDGLMA